MRRCIKKESSNLLKRFDLREGEIIEIEIREKKKGLMEIVEGLSKKFEM